MVLFAVTTRPRALPLGFLALWCHRKNEIATFSDVLYVIETENGRHFCAGSLKHVVGLDLAFAFSGPHDGGAGRVAAPFEAPDAGENAAQ